MRVAVFSGSGISAESGIPTFRTKNGEESIYSNDELMQLISTWGLENKPEELYKWHNEFRAKYRFTKPNLAHKIIREWEEVVTVDIITQNVDNLHEKAGSSNIYHLHGELNKMRLLSDLSTKPIIMECSGDLNYGDTLEDNQLLRPHTVLFGEYPYNIEHAQRILRNCDILVIVGCSFEINYTLELIKIADRKGVIVHYVDPNPSEDLVECFENTNVNLITLPATEGIKLITF